MLRGNLLISIQLFAILSSVIGSISISLYVATISPAFSSKFTSLDQLSESTTVNSGGPLLGYEQAREDPSYAINIPFSELGFSAFEPSSISIPANMTVIWFNDDDSPHSVTFNDTNPEAIAPGDIAPGGFFIHQFSTPGIYAYYDNENPSAKGRIKVGSMIQPGQYMSMLVGGDALPFEAGKVGRTTLSFVPHENVTTIPPSLSITYNVTIVDSNGTQLYSNQFEDSDGILDLELIPASSNRSSLPSNQTSTSNQTALHFVSWDPI
jgi:plastocyanin